MTTTARKIAKRNISQDGRGNRNWAGNLLLRTRQVSREREHTQAEVGPR